MNTWNILIKWSWPSMYKHTTNSFKTGKQLRTDSNYQWTVCLQETKSNSLQMFVKKYPMQNCWSTTGLSLSILLTNLNYALWLVLTRMKEDNLLLKIFFPRKKTYSGITNIIVIVVHVCTCKVPTCVLLLFQFDKVSC